MKTRCYNKNSSTYKNYGARGIAMCEEWREDIFAFLSWALKSGYEHGLSIERKDVNGPYCPDNCTWLQLSDQGYNRTNTKKVVWQNTEVVFAKLIKEHGHPYQRVAKRLSYGWSLEKAILTGSKKST